MNETQNLKLLFIINPGSGKNNKDWHQVISSYYEKLPHAVELFELPQPCNASEIKQKIEACQPHRVVAVGGDGTIKLVAECVQETGIPLAILPAGSANGMAKELGVPDNNVDKALDTAVHGVVKSIHLVKINDHVCIHLSDIGFNAFIVKEFERNNTRGMWGYVKAAWRVFWKKPQMQVAIHTDTQVVKLRAAMIVVANATKYGTGALINPRGRLDDDMFEVIVIKRISIREIFKMMVSHKPYDPKKTKLFQTRSLHIQSRRKAHFQVDGEYLGKVHEVTANIMTGVLQIVVPDDSNATK